MHFWALFSWSVGLPALDPCLFSHVLQLQIILVSCCLLVIWPILWIMNNTVISLGFTLNMKTLHTWQSFKKKSTKPNTQTISMQCKQDNTLNPNGREKMPGKNPTMLSVESVDCLTTLISKVQVQKRMVIIQFLKQENRMNSKRQHGHMVILGTMIHQC